MVAKLLNSCLACGYGTLKRVLDLGRQPLANNYSGHPIERPTYPLQVLHCLRCTHSQLSEAVCGVELYSDYKYVSGTTETLRQHFKKIAAYAAHRTPFGSDTLDIGCNDGSLMEALQAEFHFDSVTGVDPAENLREITAAKKLNVVVDFFPSQKLDYLEKQYHFISALNCLAHNPYPRRFMAKIHDLLDQGGTALIEFPYVGSTLQLKDLGQFYHEHHSYFSIQSFRRLSSGAGLQIAHVKFFKDLHGGTLRFVLRKDMAADYPGLEETWLPWEKAQHPHIDKEFEKLSLELDKNCGELVQTIWDYSKQGKTIVAYGASAKSGTLFNLPVMANAAKKVSYVVDDNPLKQGLYCPGSNLLIRSPECLKEHTPNELVILLTVHNFKDEVLARLRKSGLQGATLINYTPHVSVETI